MARRTKESYFIKSDLLERGWSHSLIARYLDPPDQEIINRTHRGGPPISLYRKERVLEQERDPIMQRAMKRSEESRGRGRGGEWRQRMRERDFSQFKEYFPLAMALERRFVY